MDQNPKTKIIIIGLDGATWTLFKPWVEKGELPTLKKLMERGVYGTPLSCIPCRSCNAIPTIYTGKNPCKWGMLDFPCFDVEIVHYKKIREKALSLWDILGKHGYKSAVLNVPSTHPPTETAGVMVSGFPFSEEDEYTYPRDFKENVKGFHSGRETLLKLITGTLRIGRSIEKSKEILDFYIKNVKKRYALIKNIIADKNFDFVIFWIDESDAAHHENWGREDFLLLFFKEMDNILKDIVEKNPDSNIIVISDHGFAAHPSHEFYPKSWLKKEGYLKLRGNIIQRWLTQATHAFIIRSPYPYRYRRTERFYSIYNKIKNLIKKDDKKADSKNKNWRVIRGGQRESKVVGIDWEKTIAVNYDFWGIKLIRENLDRDYEEVRHEIMEKMGQLKDKTGQKIIKNVWKREEIFSGKDLQKFPDIVYLPMSKFEPTGFLPFCITKKKPRKPSVPGDHLIIDEAIFIAAGPNINNVGDIGKINILDVAPTVLEALRVPIPEDMDGRALKEIFKRDSTYL